MLWRADQAGDVVPAKWFAVRAVYLAGERLRRVEGDLAAHRLRILLGGIDAHPGVNQRRGEVDVRHYLLPVGRLPDFVVIILIGENNQVTGTRQADYEKGAVHLRSATEVGDVALVETADFFQMRIIREGVIGDVGLDRLPRGLVDDPAADLDAALQLEIYGDRIEPRRVGDAALPYGE